MVSILKGVSAARSEVGGSVSKLFVMGCRIARHRSPCKESWRSQTVAAPAACACVIAVWGSAAFVYLQPGPRLYGSLPDESAAAELRRCCCQVSRDAERYLYEKRGGGLSDTFRVASGLDSLVIGESRRSWASSSRRIDRRRRPAQSVRCWVRFCRRLSR